MFAILYCGLEILSGPRQEVTVNICSENRDVISTEKVLSRLVLACKITLETLAQRSDLCLVCVPGHAVIPGTEETDRLTKLSTQKASVGPESTVGIASSKVIPSLKSLAEKLF